MGCSEITVSSEPSFSARQRPVSPLVGPAGELFFFAQLPGSQQGDSKQHDHRRGEDNAQQRAGQAREDDYANDEDYTQPR